MAELVQMELIRTPVIVLALDMQEQIVKYVRVLGICIIMALLIATILLWNSS